MMPVESFMFLICYIWESNLLKSLIFSVQLGVFGFFERLDHRNKAIWLNLISALIPRNIFGPKVPDLFAYPAPTP